MQMALHLMERRNNLKRVLKEMEALGFSDFNLEPEPEFFLFKVDEKEIQH